VLLVRHSVPAIDPEIPAEDWRLSAEGRSRCDPLATQLATYEPQTILSSPEPKARETAAVLGERLGLAVRESDDLREQARRTVGWLEREQLEAGIRVLFERRDEVVFGEESAADALARFSRAVAGLGPSAVVVSHGTVISLYAAAQTGRDPFDIWRALELPDLLVV
jgi:2,3-bisphosphoglycerate-dependent phosphoglycerate mutase